MPDTDVFGAPTTREVTVRAPCLVWAGAGQEAGTAVDSHHSSGARHALQVPPHHVWLQGDNTRNSNDSRHYGPVPVALVRGRVCFRVWPLLEAGPVARHVASAPKTWM